MKRLVLAGLFAFAVVVPALAADLPPAAPRAPATYYAPPVVAPVYNWGGFYFGPNVGYGFGQTDWTGTGGGTTGNFNVNGFIVGGTVGANFQADAWVFGVEADFDGSWIDGKNTSVCVVQCETKNTWLATARLRVGYAADRVLFYATGGGAFGNIEVNTAPTFQSTSKGGWTAGGGVEWAFTDVLTARVEYLFVDLQNASFTPPGFGTVTVKWDANLIRFGLDYKFR